MAERGVPLSVRIVPSRGGVAVRGGDPPGPAIHRRVWLGLIPLLKKGAWFMFSGMKPSVEDLGKRLASREIGPVDRDACRRATALLLDHLTPAEAWNLVQRGYFGMRGSNGSHFWIGVGNYRMTAGLERLYTEPFADFLLTVKLLLETREEEAYRMSCTKEIYTAQRSTPPLRVFVRSGAH